MSLDIIKKRSCISANKTALLMRDKTLLEMQMTHRDNNTPGLVIIIPETHEYTIHMIPALSFMGVVGLVNQKRLVKEVESIH
eukprot:3069637-Ditylum_brightwellii.AAC.1